VDIERVSSQKGETKTMAFLKIHPLHVGTITRPIVNFCQGLEPGTVSDFPLISWYIEGSDKKILVDTGGGDPSQAHPRWQPYKREKDQSIENALKKVGVRCEDIDIVQHGRPFPPQSMRIFDGWSTRSIIPLFPVTKRLPKE